MLSAHRSPWPLVWTLYLSGLLAAAQLGKLSALAPLIAAELRLSLPTVALAISLLEVGGATLGTLAGLLAQRLGLRRCLRWGLAGLALGGLGGALANGAVGLLGWRLLEALGYLGVIVSAPVLIAHHCAQHDHAAAARSQGLALTLWSTFVPVGLALGAWGSAGLADVLGWRAAVAAGGAVAALLWLGVWRAPLPAAAEQSDLAAAAELSALPSAAAARAPSPRLGTAAKCLALAFGGFALFEVGLLGLLPTFLMRGAGLSAAAAGQWTAVASVSAVAGSACAALLLRQGAGLRWPVILSIALPALLLFGVFRPAQAPAVAITLVILINMLGGVFASLAFALLPAAAGGNGQMVRANGLLAQCGASGSLLGPPLMAAAVQAGGWPAAALLGLVVSLLALPLAWVALGDQASAGNHRHRQAGHTGA